MFRRLIPWKNKKKPETAGTAHLTRAEMDAKLRREAQAQQEARRRKILDLIAGAHFAYSANDSIEMRDLIALDANRRAEVLSRTRKPAVLQYINGTAHDFYALYVSAATGSLVWKMCSLDASLLPESDWQLCLDILTDEWTKYLAAHPEAVDVRVDPPKTAAPTPVPAPAPDTFGPLRASFIAALSNSTSTTYELGKLLWEPVKKRYGQGDGAFYNIDFLTRQLSVEVSFYPNAFGYAPSRTFSITPEEFHAVVSEEPEFESGHDLRALRTRGDWDRLFNGELDRAVNEAKARADLKKKFELEQERLRNSIRLPEAFKNAQPAMSLQSAQLTIHRRFASETVSVTPNAGTYSLVYGRSSGMPGNHDHGNHTLSTAESAWLEDRIIRTVDDPDTSVFQSLAGGETIEISIIGTDKKVELNHTAALKKYNDLIGDLRNLAIYGSR